MEDLLIFPFNGNAKEALDCVSGKYRVIAFIDDQQSKHGSYRGIPVGGREWLNKIQEGAKLLAVPGSVNSHRKLDAIINSLGVSDESWARVIHPRASVSQYAEIGKNVLIMAGSVITSEAKIGNHCCILPNSVIHHDSVLEDYCTLAAGCLLAGHVSIGSKSYLGIGARIRDNVTLGKECLVGMGSNVLTSFPDGSVLVGNPAKNIAS